MYVLLRADAVPGVGFLLAVFTGGVAVVFGGFFFVTFLVSCECSSADGCLVGGFSVALTFVEGKVAVAELLVRATVPSGAGGVATGASVIVVCCVKNMQPRPMKRNRIEGI